MARLTTRDLEQLRFARQLSASGEALRIRRASGFSQSELAEPTGVTPSCISRWETGARRPRGKAGARYGQLLRALQEQEGGAGTESPSAAA